MDVHVMTKTIEPQLLRHALDEWPDHGWRVHRSPHECKRGHSGPFGINLMQAFRALADAWRPRLEVLCPDMQPDFTFRGGGLHEIPHDGFLGMHTDFTEYAETYRWANTLLYLNDKWRPEFGGALRVGDELIGPEWNTSVCLSPLTPHGHPDPWRGPGTRKSLALYWFSKTPPPNHVQQGTTFL